MEEICLIIYATTFFSGQKRTSQESLWCEVINHSSFFCYTHKNNTRFYFLLNFVCRKLKFLQKWIFFLPRSLKGMFIFTCLVGVQKVLQNGLGGSWGMWDIFPTISNICRNRKIDVICTMLQRKKNKKRTKTSNQDHLNFCYKTQWANYDFWGKNRMLQKAEL